MGLSGSKPTNWSEQMISGASDLLRKIYEHPFVSDIADGSLSTERLRFYFEQNTHYINMIVRSRSIAVAKSHDAATRDFLLERTTLIVDELRHQEQMLADLGGRVDAPVAPTCHAYGMHLANIAWTRSPVELLGAFLPCPWSYAEIGRQLKGATLTEPMAKWWSFYMSDAHDVLVDAYRDVVDRQSVDLSEWSRTEMLRNFRISLNYEYMFWNMAYNQETWPLS